MNKSQMAAMLIRMRGKAGNKSFEESEKNLGTYGVEEEADKREILHNLDGSERMIDIIKDEKKRKYKDESRQ